MGEQFTLISPGPNAPCGYPECKLDAFHEGDHELLAQASMLRGREFACCICSRRFVIYGETPLPRTCGEQQCILKLSIREADPLCLSCRCPQRPYAHELTIHEQLRPESYNPALRSRWPWSLARSGRQEPSTERMAA
jgi:hypothetical protein